MEGYRIYFVDADGHIKGFEEMVCESDEVACAYAQTVDTKLPTIEVWQEKRKVASYEVSNRPNEA